MNADGSGTVPKTSPLAPHPDPSALPQTARVAPAATPSNRHGLVLDKVVLLGRTFEEYSRSFALDESVLRGQCVLDVASGVSSFCAEASRRGIATTAFDQIYDLAPEIIQSRCEPDLEAVTRNIALAKTYNWDFYQSPEGMRRFRQRAYTTFLEDYREHGAARYVPGRLPHLPFDDRSFDLTLVSYLLFVYDDHFDYGFHKQSIREIMRVTKSESRFYPIVTFEARRSPHIERLQNDPDLFDLALDLVPTGFEFLVGSNCFLRIRHR